MSLHAVPDRAAVVDEMGRIADKLRELKPLAERYKQLEAQALQWAESASPADGFAVEGQRYSVAVGPCSEQRSIKNLKALKKALGETRWWKVVKVTFTALEKVMSTAEMDPYIERARTGGRTVTVTRKDMGGDAA